jgi:hypothetical protein
VIDMHDYDMPPGCICVCRECRLAMLVAHYGARPIAVAKDHEFALTTTERHSWILSPVSRLSGARRVLLQV